MIEHARAYLQRGWSVIPTNGKKPAISSWLEYQTRYPTEEEIERWWPEGGSNGIAIVTGKISGIVVVDVDPRHGGKAEDQAPTGIIASTGGGGSHHLYQYPSTGTVSNKAGKNGVDVRGDGGYICASPSKHASGGTYSWQKHDGALAPAPQWTREAASASGNTSGTGGPNGPTAPKGANWVADLLRDGAPEGERNDSLTRLAGYYAGKGFPLDIAREALLGWCAEKCAPPIPSAEAERTIRSSYETALRRNPVKEPAKVEVQADKALPAFRTVSMAAFMEEHGATEVNWAVEGWLPDKSITFMVSAPGGFKTWSLFDLAISVASGLPFFGEFEVTKPGPVIVIQQEDASGMLADRMGLIAYAKHGIWPEPDDIEDGMFEINVLPDMPIMLHPDRKLMFRDAEVMAALEKTIAEVRPRLILIDPLYYASGTEDFMAGAVTDMAPIKRWRDNYGCSVMFIHHTSKSAAGFSRQEGWGSQFLNAFSEGGIQVRRNEDEESIVCHRYFKATEPLCKKKIEFEISTTAPFRYATTATDATEEDCANATKRDNDPAPAPKMDLLQCVRGGSKTVEQLAEMTGKGKAATKRAIAKLSASGQVRELASGRFSIVGPTGKSEFEVS